MTDLVSAAFPALAAQVQQAPDAGGLSTIAYGLLGLAVAAGVFIVGHAVWVWRRTRGPLRSSDDAVQDLADGEVHDPMVPHPMDDDSRRDRSA